MSELCPWDKAHNFAQIFPAVQSPLVMALGSKQTGPSGVRIMLVNNQDERLIFFNPFAECFVVCYFYSSELKHLDMFSFVYKRSHCATLFLVTCAVVQRSAYGFHTASSCFWDTTSDGKRL